MDEQTTKAAYIDGWVEDKSRTYEWMNGRQKQDIQMDERNTKAGHTDGWVEDKGRTYGWMSVHLYVLLLSSAHPSVYPAFVFRSSIRMSYLCLPLIHPYVLPLSSTHPSIFPTFVFRSSIRMTTKAGYTDGWVEDKSRTYGWMNGRQKQDIQTDERKTKARHTDGWADDKSRTSICMSYFCRLLIHLYVLLLSSAHPSVCPTFVVWRKTKVGHTDGWAEDKSRTYGWMSGRQK
jgi:hypothetical protein